MSTKKAVKVGEILSETAYYVVQSVKSNGDLDVIDDLGNEITLSKAYVDSDVLTSADLVESEEKKTATELAEIFLANPYRALTVCFIPQGKEKTAKQLKADRAAWAAEVEKALMEKGRSAIEEYASRPVELREKTEPRVMRGRWYGTQDSFGRVHMIDMEKPLPDLSKGYDSRSRQVDTRTIQYVIVDKVKYILKK